MSLVKTLRSTCLFNLTRDDRYSVFRVRDLETSRVVIVGDVFECMHLVDAVLNYAPGRFNRWCENILEERYAFS